jgi:parallel beta helix pectate lyase-like protein
MQCLKRFLGLVGLLAIVPVASSAATYTVGPVGAGRQYTQLSTVFNNNNLAAGDIVEVDGSAAYAGGIVVGDDDGGTEANPVIIRWRRSAGTARPVLQGGAHTIKFEQSNHIVFEGFEVRGGTSTCVFSEAHNVTVRDAYIHDCPSHGILAADQNSGAFTLEYSEIANSGQGDTRHAIYMQSDEVAFPDTVFRMRYNYVHDATGGVLVRVRHQRAEIYYNWIEGSNLHEIELIGPDCETQKPSWTADLRREDADVVGNVIIHNSSSRSGNAVRIGGDLEGRNQGRTRLANNTILFDRAGSANAVLVQLGQGSLEMHNNVVYQPSGAPAIVRENPASNVSVPTCGPQSREPWSGGRKVAGSNNWVQTTASLVPAEWSGTLRGADPLLTNIAQRSLRPATGSPLINTGNNAPVTPAAFPFPTPLLLPAFDPPLRTKMAIGGQKARQPVGGIIDIGALEQFESTGGTPIRVNGSQPLIPPRGQAAGVPQSSSQPQAAAVETQYAKPTWRDSPARRYRRSVVD